jgi:hypothetical protein
MMEQFFALLWGDLLLTRLMGIAEINRRARTAAEAFLKLHARATTGDR